MKGGVYRWVLYTSMVLDKNFSIVFLLWATRNTAVRITFKQPVVGYLIVHTKFVTYYWQNE